MSTILLVVKVIVDFKWSIAFCLCYIQNSTISSQSFVKTIRLQGEGNGIHKNGL